MANDNYLFTSESVTEGHPDKICDQISDAVLDDLLRQDPNSKVAIETMVTTGSVHIAGEVTTRGYCDFQKVARDTLKEIGYIDPRFGMDFEDAGVWSAVHGQSPDIAIGVNPSDTKEQGAGDQGMMFGYACDETLELMPLPIMLAHRLTRKLAAVRRSNIHSFGPDGKSQVTVEYENGKPKRLDAIVIAQQHLAEMSEEYVKTAVIEQVINPIFTRFIDDNTKIHINATGRFVVGGPEGDTGVTGRKIIVDTYGGAARHGWGAFSGKDASKVDRSGAYMARYVAKNIVAAGLAEKCEVQLAYAIGVALPVSVNVNTYGTGKISEREIANLVKANFKLTPAGIIESLDLRRPIYKKTASYGHFGREEPEFTWEIIDKAETLREQAK